MSRDAQARVDAGVWATHEAWKNRVTPGLCLPSRGSLLDQCPEPRRPKVECSSTQRIGGMLQPHPISNSIDAASLFLCLFPNMFDLVLTSVSVKFVGQDDSRQPAFNSTTFVRQWPGRMFQDTVPPPPPPPVQWGESVSGRGHSLAPPRGDAETLSRAKPRSRSCFTL